MENNKREKAYLTPQEVAEMLMVSPVTVRQWAQQGQLAALNTPGGHRRFLLEDVHRFTRERRLRRQDHALRVLIVDDDAQLAGMLLELLLSRTADIAAETAHDGFHAGAKLHTFRPDVVLLDLMMPGVNGFDVCRMLKRNPDTRAIRVVAMTGFPTPENIDAALAAGAVKCLAKPLDAEAVLDAIGILDHSAREAP